MDERGRRWAPLAVGRTAEVYQRTDGSVLKLLRPGFPDAMAEHEARIAAFVNERNLPGPRFLGSERVDGREGLAFERVDGPTMTEGAASRPWQLRRLARRFARLHAQIHATGGEGLPSRRAEMADHIRGAAPTLGKRLAGAALERLASLPDGEAFTHGDMHPGNVIMGEDRPVVIDWLTAARGAPAADVARTAFLITGSGLPAEMPRAQRLVVWLLRRRFAAAYLAEYRRLRALDPAELRSWRLPVLAARLGEGIAEERDQLLAEIEAELSVFW